MPVVFTTPFVPRQKLIDNNEPAPKTIPAGTTDATNAKGQQWEHDGVPPAWQLWFYQFIEVTCAASLGRCRCQSGLLSFGSTSMLAALSPSFPKRKAAIALNRLQGRVVLHRRDRMVRAAKHASDWACCMGIQVVLETIASAVVENECGLNASALPGIHRCAECYMTHCTGEDSDHQT